MVELFQGLRAGRRKRIKEIRKWLAEEHVLFKEGLADELSRLGIDTQKAFRLWLVGRAALGVSGLQQIKSQG